MASKKDNRKMVDILERMGMIKKDEEEQPVPEQDQTVTGADAVTVTVADADANANADVVAVAVAETPAQAAPSGVPAAETALLAAPVSSDAPLLPASTPAYQTQPAADQSAYSQIAQSGGYEKKSLTAGSALSSLSDSFWDDTPAEPEPVERYLEIEELYQMFQMQTSGVDTVYLLEEYIKTLPDSLPADLRRSIIVRIVHASGFDFDKLLSDGIDRVSRLNDYAAEFASRTDIIVTQQNETISELERQIELVRAVINERKNLHKKQFLSIENEAQRLKKILDFITK